MEKFFDNFKLHKHEAAFTLSEILITLSILGIVAAISIPNIIGHFKKNYTVTRLKQAYSILTNATEIAEVLSQESSDNWDYPKNSNSFVLDLLLPQMNVAKKGGHCLGDKGKELKGKSDPGYTYINLGNNTYANVYWSGTNGAILKNGMSIIFNKCQPASTGYNRTNMYCQGFIDIDGPNKGANQMNKDIFTFFFTGAESDTETKNPRFTAYTVEHHLKRYGTTADCKYANGCLNVKSNCKNGNISSTCWVYIMLNNWKIPDDYPVKF